MQLPIGVCYLGCRVPQCFLVGIVVSVRSGIRICLFVSLFGVVFFCVKVSRLFCPQRAYVVIYWVYVVYVVLFFLPFVPWCLDPLAGCSGGCVPCWFLTRYLDLLEEFPHPSRRICSVRGRIRPSPVVSSPVCCSLAPIS